MYGDSSNLIAQFLIGDIIVYIFTIPYSFMEV